MSEQMQLLANMIESAKLGNLGAQSVLRKICREAANNAPAEDLIKMSEFLYVLGLDAAKKQLESN